MNEIIAGWKQIWFLQPLAELLMIAAFIVFVSKKRQLGTLKLVPLYLGAFIVFTIVKYVLALIEIHAEDPRLHSFIITFPDFATNVFEFIAFIYFLYHAALSETRKEIIHFGGVFGMIGYLFMYIFVISVESPISVFRINGFYLVGTGTLFLMSLVYLADLYYQKTDLDPHWAANFWTLGGLLFYLAGCISYKIVANYFFVNDPGLYKSLSSIVWLYYCILFILLIQAWRSRPGKRMLKESGNTKNTKISTPFVFFV
jgi:hypothetical protein